MSYSSVDAEVVNQMRAIARARLASQRPDHTLQPTALVAEAWLKLRNHFDVPTPTPAFYKTASEAMRQILIDHARAKATLKRDAGRRVDADVGLVAEKVDERTDPDQLLALDAAIAKLEALDAQAANVVKLRFFTGMPVEQTAEVLGVSERTVKRDWQFARTWLAKELAGIAV